MNFFQAKDKRPRAEPILIVAAFILDYFVGKNFFTLWLGWWLFLNVIVCFPAHIYSYMLLHTLGPKEFSERYKCADEWILSHRTFVFSLYYSLFLYFWWKWL